ncbi:hypothetical protein [Candidatus Lokiarchaeum ossiferum]|uniref:hypothetical protein n=1 Tax=Candidatus Lokiarchaeum ossiferum TaxID=2951803 RepID=UPI00352E0A2E
MEKYQTKSNNLLDYTQTIKKEPQKSDEGYFMNTMFQDPEYKGNSTEDTSDSLLKNKNTPQQKIQRSSPIVKPTIPSKRNKALENMLRRIQMREITSKQQSSNLGCNQNTMGSDFHNRTNLYSQAHREISQDSKNYQNSTPSEYPSFPDSQQNTMKNVSEINQRSNLGSNSNLNLSQNASFRSQDNFSNQNEHTHQSVNSLIKRRTIQNISRNSMQNANSLNFKNFSSEKRLQPPPPIMPPKSNQMNYSGENFATDSNFQPHNQINPSHIAHKNPKTFEITAKLNSTLNSNRRFEYRQNDSNIHNIPTKSHNKSSESAHNSISSQNLQQIRPLRSLVFPKSSSSSNFKQQTNRNESEKLQKSYNFTEKYSSIKQTPPIDDEYKTTTAPSRFSASFRNSQQKTFQNNDSNHLAEDHNDSNGRIRFNQNILNYPANSNVISNVNSNVNSNVISNVNSNVNSNYSKYPSQRQIDDPSNQSTNQFTLNRPLYQSPISNDEISSPDPSSYVQRKFTQEMNSMQSDDVYKTNRNQLNSALFHQNPSNSPFDNNVAQSTLVPENSLQNMDPQERKTMIIEKLQFFEQSEVLKHQILKILHSSTEGIADCQMLRKIKKSGRYLGSVALGMILYNMIESFGEDMVQKQYSHGSYVYSLSEEFRDLYQIALINSEDE